MGKIVTLGEVVSDIYRGEELSDVELGFVARPGGAPANVAVAASRLGSEAAFIGSVGEDLFGDFILRALEAEGVDTSGVGRQNPPTRTSLAFVEIGTDGDREFTFYRSSPAADAGEAARVGQWLRDASIIDRPYSERVPCKIHGLRSLRTSWSPTRWP